MDDLGDIKRVFNTTSGINKNNLKDKIIKTLKKADGETPIDELEKISVRQVKNLFPDFADQINNNNRIRFLLNKIEEKEVFEQIFEIVE